MPLKIFLHQAKAVIDRHLSTFISEQAIASKQYDQQVLQHVAQFATAGKTIRGTLVCLGYQMFTQDKVQLPAFSNPLPTESFCTHSACTPSPSQQQQAQPLPLFVVQAAVATELVHSALLMQDDIMDQDLLRRGLPAMHARYQRQMQARLQNCGLSKLESLKSSAEAKPGELYGQSMAMCLSDLLFFWSFDLLAKLEVGLELKQQLLTSFNQEITRTIWGQIDDVTATVKQQFYAMGSKQQPITQEQILNIYRLKSARYTICNPLLAGAILAQASSSQLKVLEAMAENLGLVFQIQDDNLTFFEQEEQVGKKLGNDIEQNKPTLHRLLLYQSAQKKDRQILDEIFGQSGLNQQQLEQVQHLADKYQLQTKLDEIKSRHLSQARQGLEQLKISSDFKDLLQEFMIYLNLRKK